MFLQNYKRINLEKVVSTNLHASDLLSGKLISEPTIIVADFQTGGKGQGNNVWESGPVLNLLFSLVVFPLKIKAKEQFYLSKITAIALKETISEHLQAVKIKWPNDILVNKQKISGVLIENTLKADVINSCVIGVGLNVNQTDFTVPAVSFKSETGKEFDRKVLLDAFLNTFHYWFEILQSRDFAQIDSEYYKSLYGFQEWHWFSWGGVDFEAFIEGVEPDGYLVLKAKDGKIFKFGFREVEFLINKE